MVIVLSLQTIVDPLGIAFGRLPIDAESTLFMYIESGKVHSLNVVCHFSGNSLLEIVGILSVLRLLHLPNMKEIVSSSIDDNFGNSTLERLLQSKNILLFSDSSKSDGKTIDCKDVHPSKIDLDLLIDFNVGKSIDCKDAHFAKTLSESLIDFND